MFNPLYDTGTPITRVVIKRFRPKFAVRHGKPWIGQQKSEARVYQEWSDHMGVRHIARKDVRYPNK